MTQKLLKIQTKVFERDKKIIINIRCNILKIILAIAMQSCNGETKRRLLK